MIAISHGGATDASAAASGRQGRTAFALAAVLVYVFGLIARDRAIDDKAVLIVFSLVMDTIFVALLIVNQKLIDRRPPTSIDLAAWGFILLLAGGSTLSMVAIALFAETLTGLGLKPLALSLPHRFIYYFFIFLSFNFAGLWLRIQFRANRTALSAAAAESAAARAEMQRLRQQLAPHFLFNGINFVAVEIPERPQVALDMLGELSSYLRYSLEAADLAAVPVSVEMAALEAFLRVQSMRFEPGFCYSLAADDAARECPIPPFLVQAMFQETVRPGAAGGVAVDIRFRREGSALVVTLAGLGGDMADAGLAALRNRLELLYPGRYRLDQGREEGRPALTLRLSGAPS
ncbi:sensor histidine kinase [Zavarzinia aquatilis]|uniref:Signal transduction histidine kinase internal region domain-containing protein n=1 Tax=Zavarzinia aquatilis TaxID=2211142 RepID=A0A317DVK5_9PROT|nr:histidine kinase [Zavarzinia aquatilis]PWR17906.1 hypothetical protein DKG74_20295 [Zavarzinia aquatilis]